MLLLLRRLIVEIDRGLTVGTTHRIVTRRHRAPVTGDMLAVQSDIAGAAAPYRTDAALRIVGIVVVVVAAHASRRRRRRQQFRLV